MSFLNIKALWKNGKLNKKTTEKRPGDQGSPMKKYNNKIPSELGRGS